MKIIKLNPKTNGSRHQIKLEKSLLAKKNNLLKLFFFKKHRSQGRSTATGRITVWHKGSSCKRRLREIKFSNEQNWSIVLFMYYDPMRSTFVSLNFDLNSFSFFNSLSTLNTYPGSLLINNQKQLELKLGYKSTLSFIPTGSLLHSISLSKNQSIKYVRSAGTFCQLVQKNQERCKIRLPSGVLFDVPLFSCGTLGTLSNTQSNQVVIGKAGRNRLKGIRPTVRGIAMNPVDHPHGGRSNGGRPSVTPWGLPTRGKPTSKKKYI